MKALLDIVADPHVGGLPLYVVLVSRLQVIQRVAHLGSRERTNQMDIRRINH